MIDVAVVGGIFREVLDADAAPRRRLGGSGLVAAVIAGRLGVRTALVSFVGEEDAETGTAIFRAGGVDYSSVMVLPGASGTFVFPAAGSRPWPMYRPAEALPASVPSIPPARAYLVFGMPDFDPIQAGWLSELPSEATLLWDRQGWLSRARDHTAASRLPPSRKAYIANEDEALTDFSAVGTEALLSKLPPVGFEWAVIKRGPEGCIAVEKTVNGNAVHSAQGFPVETPDTIGSGDVFAGAIAAEIAVGTRIPDAAVRANAVASAFLRLGGDPLAPGLSELAGRLLDARANSE